MFLLSSCDLSVGLQGLISIHSRWCWIWCPWSVVGWELHASSSSTVNRPVVGKRGKRVKRLQIYRFDTFRILCNSLCRWQNCNWIRQRQTDEHLRLFSIFQNNQIPLFGSLLMFHSNSLLLAPPTLCNLLSPPPPPRNKLWFINCKTSQPRIGVLSLIRSTVHELKGRRWQESVLGIGSLKRMLWKLLLQTSKRRISGIKHI